MKLITVAIVFSFSVLDSWCLDPEDCLFDLHDCIDQLPSSSHCVTPLNSSTVSTSYQVFYEAGECHELESYVEQHLFQESSTTFYFMDGIHTLTSELLVENISNLTLKTANLTGNVHIMCSKEVGLVFRRCNHLTIQGLTFIGCGQVLDNFDNNLSTKTNITGALVFINGRNITLDGVTVTNSPHFGLLVYGVHGYVHITSSSFIHSGEGSNSDAGNVIIATDTYTSDLQAQLSTNFYLEIHDSVFSYNKNTPSPFKYYCRNLASGLSIVLKQNYVFADLSGLYLSHNSGCHGGNLAILFEGESQFKGNISLENCTFEHGNAERGGGMYVYYYDVMESQISHYIQPCLSRNDSIPQEILTVKNTKFYCNSASVGGGGVYLGLTESFGSSSTAQIILEDCVFERNTIGKAGYGGAAIDNVNFISFEYKQQTIPQFQVFVRNSVFTHHTYLNNSKWKNSGSGVIYTKTNHYIAF